MMKNKNPGFITEHLYRAVRSEGPVIIILSSSEDLFSLLHSPPSTLIYGMLVKKKKFKAQLKHKRNALKIKKMIKKPDRACGTTDMESPLVLWGQFKISWHLSHHRPLWMKLSNTLATADQSTHMKIINKVWTASCRTKIKRC